LYALVGGAIGDDFVSSQGTRELTRFAISIGGLYDFREARKSIYDGAQDSEVIIYLGISFTWFSVRTRETERIANLQLDGDCPLIHIQ
jgi:hypothetical protein